ncbi:hypothetical protein LINPERHAP1_LOCUS26825 [Linum perenne]
MDLSNMIPYRRLTASSLRMPRAKFVTVVRAVSVARPQLCRKPKLSLKQRSMRPNTLLIVPSSRTALPS